MPQIEGQMSKRIEQPRRHGHWDPRYAPTVAALPHGRVSVVTARNSPTGRRNKVNRFELCDSKGDYAGTFVTEVERWEVGDVFTTGDGHSLRITAISAPETSTQRPAYTNLWNVEAVEPRSP